MEMSNGIRLAGADAPQPGRRLENRGRGGLCREHGQLFRAGKGTSHCHAKHPQAREILTIPARRSIKPVYIRKLVRYIEMYGDKR
jgi:predicted RNA binding protein YcfA (HicA-like mRNA interferase family)